MTVGLEWLLARPELHLRLVTGVAAGRRLTWAHSIDVDDPTPWLTGGELILTTGLRLGRSARAQRAYVGRLADAGVTALGFGVGVRHDAIPTAIVDACAERALPLVKVPEPTPFIAVTQAVARRLSEDEVESLQRALSDQRRITRSAVRSGLPGVVGMVSKELDCDAVVLDEYGAVMASSTTDALTLELVSERWRRQASGSRRGTWATATALGTLEIQTLQGRSSVVGWLAVHRRGEASPTDRLILNQAAGLVTLLLDWPAELVAAYHDLGGTLLELLLDPAQDPSTLVPHLRHFGFEPAGPVMLAVLTAPRGQSRLLKVVTDVLETSARPHVVAPVDGGVAALLTAGDAATLVDLLERSVAAAGIAKVVIGVSGSLPQTAVATGLVPAGQAAAAARRERRGAGWFDQLTLGAVVADEGIRSRVWALAGPALDRLAREVTPRDVDLLPSLEEFLRHNGSWESAARALGVHRHTLRSRMARVQELTGLDLDVAENRVLLLLALMSRSR
jgi:purine catabolism regulator